MDDETLMCAISVPQQGYVHDMAIVLQCDILCCVYSCIVVPLAHIGPCCMCGVTGSHRAVLHVWYHWLT